MDGGVLTSGDVQPAPPMWSWASSPKAPAGAVTFYVGADCTAGILLMWDCAYERRLMLPQLAASIRGKTYFSLSTCYAMVRRAAPLPLMQRQYWHKTRVSTRARSLAVYSTLPELFARRRVLHWIDNTQLRSLRLCMATRLNPTSPSSMVSKIVRTHKLPFQAPLRCGIGAAGSTACRFLAILRWLPPNPGFPGWGRG